MRQRYTLPYVLLIGALVSGCQRERVSNDVAYDFRCTLTEFAEQLKPPEVTFVNDTGRTMPAWRARVGPPVVDRAGRLCEDAAIDSLLVVSWNVHLGHADVRRFISELRNGRVVPGVRVQHFVILVQEAFRESSAVPARGGARGCTRKMGGEGLDIEDIADSLGLALFYVPSMRNGCDRRVRQDRGNAILSTLPLSNLQAVELPLVRQRRVAALAEVNGRSSAGDEWTVVLASVHFENRGTGLPRNWVHGRARQARAFVTHLPDSLLLAVGGDFNSLRGSNEPAVRIVGARFANSPPHQTHHTFVSYAVMRSHLDYLFFRCHGQHRTKYWRARERYGSDHYPIMGYLRVS